MAGIPNPHETPTVPVWPDAAEALGLSRSAAYRAARRGDIPTITVGRRLLVPTARLRALVGLDIAPPAA